MTALLARWTEKLVGGPQAGTSNSPKAINTHNTELQLIKIHISKTKHITVANTYFPPRDTTSPHYNTVDTDIAYCIRHVTNIPDSILTCDVNAHSTLWYPHTDDHRGQLISDIISNSEHIILNTDTSIRVPHTTLQQPHNLAHIIIVYSGMRLMFPIAMHTIEIIKQYNTCTLYIHNSKR